MAKVKGQEIPAEIEESFTKLLTKQHAEHTIKQGAFFSEFKFGENKVFGKVATSDNCLFGAFFFGKHSLFGESPQQYTCNRRAPFKQPTWQGFIVDPPTKMQSTVRHAFKKCVNCWNKLTWAQKGELWDELQANPVDEGYYNYWHRKGNPYFYYDIKHPWCPDPGEAFITWDHAYYKRTEVIEAEDFEIGWNAVAAAWDGAEEHEDPDPNMGHHAGMIFCVRYVPDTGKYYLSLYGMRGEGRVGLTNMNTSPITGKPYYNYLLGEVLMIEYQFIQTHYNGILWIPEPTDEQIADQDKEWWNGGMWVKGKSFDPGSCAWGVESEDPGYPWTEKTMKIGSLEGNYGEDDLKFEIKNSYYTPNSVKGDPPTTDDIYIYGGMGKKLIFSIGWREGYWGKAGPYG